MRNNTITKIPVPLMDFNKISSGFGWRIHPITGKWHFHQGIDYPDVINTPLYSIKDGCVIISKMQSNRRGYGNYVVIEHDGDYSHFAHLSKRVVSVGQKVRCGDLIGYMGSTGDSTGCHLHFGICTSYNLSNPEKSIWVDPLPILKSGIVSSEVIVDGDKRVVNRILINNENWFRLRDFDDKLRVVSVSYDNLNQLPIIND